MGKSSEKKDKWSGFRISTVPGVVAGTVLGALFIFWGYRFFEDGTVPREILLFIGETFISVTLLSLAVELHSIQDNYRKVRDYLLLEEPSFVENYDMEKTNRLIELAIKQKIRLASGKKLEESAFLPMLEEGCFSMQRYLEGTVEYLGKDGFYCTEHKRKIEIDPVSNTRYKIEITVELELQNITRREINYTQKYNFYYVSQRQINSFELLNLQIDGADTEISKLNYKPYPDNRPTTTRHPFNYFVSFEVPLVLPAGGRTRYVLNYRYENYLQACYITYSPPFVTKSFSETYSLVGKNAMDYQIHASAYSPYKKKAGDQTKNLVSRINEETLLIKSDSWIVPGSGFVAVVRSRIEEPGADDENKNLKNHRENAENTERESDLSNDIVVKVTALNEEFSDTAKREKSADMSDGERKEEAIEEKTDQTAGKDKNYVVDDTADEGSEKKGRKKESVRHGRKLPIKIFQKKRK